MKKGLVLEGGGTKGAYQIGAYKALRDLVFIVKKEQIKEEVKTKQLSLFDK